MYVADTIVAPVTPPGTGAVAIVRLSGPRAFEILDAIFRPAKFTTKRVAPELRVGIGGARLRFIPVDDQSCAQVPGCPASNHFQQHVAVATRWYVTDHLFLRPAFDLHHVNNLVEFGSNWVPRYSVGIGYSIGRER